jgi:hypothetical protein
LNTHNQAFIRQKARERRVKWTRHALNELADETVSVRDVEMALQEAQIIEEYAHRHRYLPDCLFLVFVFDDEPMHCVIDINQPQDYILIVTVYRPKTEEWNDDWRTRK